MMSDLLRNPEGYPLTRVECVDCGWYNSSGDDRSTRHAGVVHSTMLHPGHVVRLAVSRGIPIFAAKGSE